MLQKTIYALYALLAIPSTISHNTGTIMAPQTKIEAGVYEHYRGNHYLVLFVAQNTETEQEEVVYQSLYGDLRVWARPLQMFLETVQYQGQVVPRFRKVAEASEADKFIKV